MQVALGILCNAWAFCERRKGRKMRDSWPTDDACSWYFHYSHILSYNLLERFYGLAKDKATLQKMFLVTQLLPVVFRQASSSTGNLLRSLPQEVSRNRELQSSGFGSNIYWISKVPEFQSGIAITELLRMWKQTGLVCQGLQAYL